jgi:hypothetical protein
MRSNNKIIDILQHDEILSDSEGSAVFSRDFPNPVPQLLIKKNDFRATLQS